MHDIFGVFGPVLDFPRVLPQIVLAPQFVGEKTADFPRSLSLKSLVKLQQFSFNNNQYQFWIKV